ncbi:unnamed protein product [Taenia asiatica]|uniref:Uncharacterized protein n=1 Tax=Taenia asiatica TaxID=60517 RepID=A0A0R3WEL8_TAEAS|nr:unnamed protein product [Taenia asiatica]
MRSIRACVLEGENRLGEKKSREANNGEEVELSIAEGESIAWTKNNIKEEQKEEGQREKEEESGKEEKAEWRLFPTKDKVEEK